MEPNLAEGQGFLSKEPGPVQRGLSWLIRGGRPSASHALMAPTTGWMASCLFMPLLLLLALSFTKRGPYGALQWTVYTLHNFRRCLNPEYLPVLLRTLCYAGLTSGLSQARCVLGGMMVVGV